MMFDVNVNDESSGEKTNITAGENDMFVMMNLGIDEHPEIWEPITVLLDMHPSYLHIFKHTIISMFYGDGPLPLQHRHYLAIMAASRHRCQYLVDLHKSEFVRCGGDENWLSGSHPDAQKLRDLDGLNRVLAHQPWQIQTSQLQALLQVSNPNNWSLSELVHGAAILSHIHAFCSFVHGCGIGFQPSTTTIGNVNGTTTTTTANHNHQSASAFDAPPNDTSFTLLLHQNGSSADSNVEELMACMRELSEKHASFSQEDKLQQFLDINVQSSEITPEEDGHGATMACVKQTFASFTDDLNFSYADFAKRNEPSLTHTFKIHDYSWDDQGYGVINQLCGELCNVIDDKFRMIQNLTYRTMGDHKDVDTSKYRVSVWNYIQSLYGIRHDDYDYSEVNRLLSRQMKIFVKTVGCYPERTTDTLRASVMVDFQRSEKVHVNLLIFESRFQAELLYLLRALTRIGY